MVVYPCRCGKGWMRKLWRKCLIFWRTKSILWLGCDGDIYKWQGQEDRKWKIQKQRKWMYAWWNMSTPDKKYAKRHNQTLAQTLRLEARQRKLYFCFFCWSFNTMFNRYLWVNRNSERPSSVGELICLRKTEQKNGQY